MSSARGSQRSSDDLRLVHYRRQALNESLPLLEDPDESLRAMATEEVAELQQQIDRLLSATLPAHLLPPSTSAHLSCIIELKAGMGGSEAAIFTREIRDMLIRYATNNRWKCTILESTSASDTAGADGLKDCTIRVEGDGAYGRLKWEAGVHRVQRVPLTETKGRTHTSTMAVIVRPLPHHPGNLCFC
jgi:peptide chain release factor 1